MSSSPTPAFRAAGTALVERLRRLDRLSIAAGIVAALAALAVFTIAVTVFAYHSSNHDEGVYLLQAALLLEGQLELHAGELAGAFRPWFFVEDGGRLYPKYTPVPAAMFAVTMGLFGEPRVTLAAVAAGNALLTYCLGSIAVDRRVGVVAAVLFAASPMALVTSATFLPYAPTTFLNLLFAVAYLRGVRDGSLVAAGVAGVAIGLAFFARPFTAVLFALPFTCHALYRVGDSARAEGVIGDGSRLRVRSLPAPLRRHGLTALLGLAFVGLTLAYNLRMTGSPLVFPYEAFAPQDGPGFGTRRILGHSIEYTPSLALEANGHALWYLATRWFVAGPIGTALAVLGVGIAARRWLDTWRGVDGSWSFEQTAGAVLAGLFVTIPVGNLFFWGNYNVLATMSDPTDGLVSQFGPFYHFDLLAPLSLFAALAIIVGWDRLVPALHSSIAERGTPRVAQALVVGLVIASLLVVAIAAVSAVATPLDRNAAHADKHEAAYEPIEAADLEAAESESLVFVPTPYGDWQNHPFQYLRNDDGLDGQVVHALDRGPDDDFAVVDAYPNRSHYRYTYRGEWTANPDQHVRPKLDPLEIRRGSMLAGKTVVGVPARVERATVRLESQTGEHAQHSVVNPGDSITVSWSINSSVAHLENTDSAAVDVGETDLVVLVVTLTQPDGSTLTYRQEATVRTSADGTVEAIWPPERSVCRLTTDCGNEGTYLPDADVHLDGVSFETRLDANA